VAFASLRSARTRRAQAQSIRSPKGISRDCGSRVQSAAPALPAATDSPVARTADTSRSAIPDSGDSATITAAGATITSSVAISA
jgi:hypothetical protein